jgi:hypothetical protein
MSDLQVIVTTFLCALWRRPLARDLTLRRLVERQSRPDAHRCPKLGQLDPVAASPVISRWRGPVVSETCGPFSCF